jgi:hypothetical protein
MNIKSFSSIETQRELCKVVFMQSQSRNELNVLSCIRSWLRIRLSLPQFKTSSTHSWPVVHRFDCNRCFPWAERTVATKTGINQSSSSLDSIVSHGIMSICQVVNCIEDTSWFLHKSWQFVGGREHQRLFPSKLSANKWGFHLSLLVGMLNKWNTRWCSSN